jgi:hypothetical protein
VETIAAVIEAFGKGEIELEAVDAEHSHQTFRLPEGKRYSLATVARFLGWVKPSDASGRRSRPWWRRISAGRWSWRKSRDTGLVSSNIVYRVVNITPSPRSRGGASFLTAR